MAIPSFDGNGFLPEGIHLASEKELFERFRVFHTSVRRINLSHKLRDYLGEIRNSGFDVEVFVDGSFVTSKDEPSDIDLVLILPADFETDENLSPYKTNPISARYVKRYYGFDILVANRGSDNHGRYLNDFQDVKGSPGLRKGIIRLV
jgi:hypothetical protein